MLIMPMFLTTTLLSAVAVADLWTSSTGVFIQVTFIESKGIVFEGQVKNRTKKCFIQRTIIKNHNSSDHCNFDHLSLIITVILWVEFLECLLASCPLSYSLFTSIIIFTDTTITRVECWEPLLVMQWVRASQRWQGSGLRWRRIIILVVGDDPRTSTLIVIVLYEIEVTNHVQFVESRQ